MFIITDVVDITQFSFANATSFCMYLDTEENLALIQQLIRI